jgi:starch synthase
MPKLNILITASECVPFAKTGGLADVVGILPKFLKKLGHDVRVIMPRYYLIDRAKYGLNWKAGPLGVPMGIIGEQWCEIYEGTLPNSDIPVYFIEHEVYYGRAELYNVNGKGFMDNDNRFVFLSRASLQACKLLDFRPDIIHAHDWHTAVAPVFLNTLYKDDPFFAKTSSVLTIHNLQYQGQFYPGLMDVLGVGWSRFHHMELENHGNVNLLKAGIFHAKMVNTVSDGYKNEMLNPQYAYGLQDAISFRWVDVYGILNGMDYEEWDPSNDKFIASSFDIGNMAGKAVCKAELQKEYGLPVRDDIPVFGVVSRLVDQKGVDILAEAIHKILALDIQFVMLGEGEPWSHFYFGDIMAAYPDKFAVRIGYDHALSHKIEAGADFFVMPSKFEPCGLNQMYSLRYGTLPIVRATGGLDDTIENLSEYDCSGDGFKFFEMSASALFDTIGWAVYTYYHKKDCIEKMRENAMSKRFTWDESAKKYEELYYRALEKIGISRE